MPSPGKAFLVGAGPGDPELLTLKAQRILSTCDVLLYDYLVDSRILSWVNPMAEQIYVGKSGLTGHHMKQEDIQALMVELCRQGKIVCRLKGGDPYLFGRGAEEGQELFEAGVPFEIVPGITSAIAAPAYAGIPITHRDHASCVSIITGHEDPTKPESMLDWPTLAKMSGTLVFLMGVKQLGQITAELIAHGKNPQTPVGVVRWGTRPTQETVTGTLETIAELVKSRGLMPPCIIIVGDVVTCRPELNWFESLPLFGKTIAITRARQQSSELKRQLMSLGANVIEFPTIAITPPDDISATQAQLKESLPKSEWVIFTSPNGVDYTFEYLFAQGLDARCLAQTKIATIGPATAQALKNYGLNADLMPREFIAEAIFEALLAKEGTLSGKRFCLPRADIARDAIAIALEEAGALVDQISVYQTVMATEGDDVTELSEALAQGNVDWITFSSSSTVSNFARRMSAQLQANPQLLDNTRFVSIGPITSATMRELLGRVDAEASVHTIPGLIDTLISAEASGAHSPELTPA